ncbi:MAG: peptidylprolyl isomerase [Alphaproteobacteria bacterium]|nr:peptidylprolyl isomerase [Alphaproteobacteria bacterium]
MIKTLFLTIILVATSITHNAQASEDNTLYIMLPQGQVTIRMMPEIAPKHVEQVRTLVRQGFYDNLEWFRVIKDFVAQTGYPLDKSKGTGGKSTLPDLPDEFSKYKFKRGTVGMGKSDAPNSANSQFFICLSDEMCKDLTGHYTAWGQVTDGMDLVDQVKIGTPPKNPDKTIKMAIAADLK